MPKGIPSFFERGYMVFRLALIEFKRLVTRRRYSIIFSLLALFGIGLILFSTGGLHGAPDEGGEWTAWSVLLQVALPIFILTPIFIGHITGSSLAEDSSSGYQKFLEIRVNSHVKFISGKILGIISASFFGGLLAYLLIVLFAFFMYPRTPIDLNIARFDTGLFGSSPYLYLVFIGIMLGLGTAASSGIACFASVWIRNPYIAGSMPVGFMLFSIVFDSLAGTYFIDLQSLLSLSSSNLSFVKVLMVWIGYITIFYGLTILLFDRRNIIRPTIKE